MPFLPPPPTAVWRHIGARSGFEVAYFRELEDGWRIEGCTTALEGSHSWALDYEIVVDTFWLTRTAHISAMSVSGRRSTMLETDGLGHWQVDGAEAGYLDGCLDVDLESSAMTNALPVRRMGLAIGDERVVVSAYVRAIDLAVERLEQVYARVDYPASRQSYDYTASAFGFACRLTYYDDGLVLEYPGLAERVG